MKYRTAVLFVLLIIIGIPAFAQDPTYFLMLTDPQMGMFNSDKDFAQETANFEFAVAAVNRLKPAFVVILGDLTNKTGDAKQIKEYKRIAKKIDKSIPVYLVPGNHDVGHVPTPATVAAYRKNFGRDYYSFRAGSVYGIVLNSTLIVEPKNVSAEYEAQMSWLKIELEAAKASGLPNIIVFQHHPYFTKDANEADQYSSIQAARRKIFLEMLHSYGVHYVFAGHTHQIYVAKDGNLEMTATGPVGQPFGDEGSGIRLAIATSAGVQHQYYGFGKLPSKLPAPTGK
jgi:serine/threonine-protein phosphatase CPPED1